MSKSTRQKVLFFLLGTLLCVLARQFGRFPGRALDTVLYGGLFIAWALTVNRRILNTYTRKTLTGLVWYMLFLFVCRGCRYSFFEGDMLLSRLLWYAYYVTFLTVPLLCFFAADSLDEEGYSYRGFQTGLIAADTILCIAFITNDYHHLAFGDLGLGNMADYHSYGPLYYLALVWIVALLLATMLRLLSRIRIWRNLSYPWLPLWVLLLFGCWFFMNHLNGGRTQDIIWRHLFNLPEMFCLMIIAFWESCIQIGLVPSNTDYENIIRRSGIAAVFTNDDESRYLVSENALIPEGIRVDDVAGKPRNLDKNTVLYGRKLEGGGILWTEDLSSVNRYNEALTDAGEQLSEENTLLQAENEWKEQHYTLEVQNRLYDDINRLVSPQLSKIREEISFLKKEPDGPALRQRLAVLSFLGAYVKRRANLTLISMERKDGRIPLKELLLSVRESLEYLKLTGVVTGMYETAGELYPEAGQVLLAYDFFQMITERVISEITAVQVRLTQEKDGWRLRLVLADPKSMPSAEWKSTEVIKARGNVRIYMEDETGYAEISFRDLDHKTVKADGARAGAFAAESAKTAGAAERGTGL